MAGACGDCSMCCKLPILPIMEKPANAWCRECKTGRGCEIYDRRPEPCREFVCLWLDTQSTPWPLDVKFRPDKCKVMISATTNPKAMQVMIDPQHPNAHKVDEVEQLLGRIIMNMGVALVVGDASKADKVIYRNVGGFVARQPITMQGPDENGMMWFEDKGYN